MMKLRTSLFIIFTISLLLPTFSFADDDATVKLEPKNPTPYSSVTVTLVSYTFNVNTSLIVWSVKGKEVGRGVGEKKIVVKTSGIGEAIPVHISATTADGGVYALDITIIPQSVTILYETPESYTPLFYEGHSLPGEGALINFVAVANMSERGAIIPPSSLSYSWYVNGEYIESQSGIGRQLAKIKLDTLNPYTTIKVVAYSPLGSTSENTIDIYPHEVMPLLYTYDDILGGNYSSLLLRRFEATDDFTILLEPFFLSTKNNQQGKDSYSWYLDGLPITPIGGRLLSLRPKSNSYGSRSLSITMENSARILQNAKVDLDLVFDTR